MAVGGRADCSSPRVASAPCSLVKSASATAASSPAACVAWPNASVRIWVCRYPGDAAHPRDPAVTEVGQVPDDRAHRRRVVSPDRWERPAGRRVADRHGGQAQLLQDGDPRIVELQVYQQYAVHPALRPPGLVGGDLGGLVLGQRQQQGDVVGGKLRLDAGDELHVEGLEAQGGGGTPDDEPERAGVAVGQGAGRAARLESHFRRDGDDALPGRRRHARLPVKRERHRRPGHPGAARDITDGRTFHFRCPSGAKTIPSAPAPWPWSLHEQISSARSRSFAGPPRPALIGGQTHEGNRSD